MAEVFYASLITSLVALGSVLISLWINQGNFNTTRREEREKAREEREFNAKHKALLSATEAVLGCYYYYLTIADRELPQNGMTPEELSRMGIAISRLHFYCGLETIKRSVALGKIFSTSYAKAIRAKLEPEFLKAEINKYDEQISHLKLLSNDFQQQLFTMLSASNQNHQLIIAYNESININNIKISELKAAKDTLIKKHYEATERCRDVVMANFIPVQYAMRDMLIISRNELSFPIDEEAYTALINDSIEKAHASIKSLFDEVRNQVRQKMQRPQPAETSRINAK